MRLLLVDGSYYAYRSFFAIRGLSNSHGEPTNAIFGFVKAIRRMIKELKPDLAAVCWDSGLPARRTELQPGYKQHRADMPTKWRRRFLSSATSCPSSACTASPCPTPRPTI